MKNIRDKAMAPFPVEIDTNRGKERKEYVSSSKKVSGKILTADN